MAPDETEQNDLEHIVIDQEAALTTRLAAAPITPAAPPPAQFGSAVVRALRGAYG